MQIRNQKLDVMLNPSEIETVKADAEKKGLPLSHYVRKKLGLPIPTRGRPKAESQAK